jgi:hypothetical protein
MYFMKRERTIERPAGKKDRQTKRQGRGKVKNESQKVKKFKVLE